MRISVRIVLGVKDHAVPKGENCTLTVRQAASYTQIGKRRLPPFTSGRDGALPRTSTNLKGPV